MGMWGVDLKSLGVENSIGTNLEKPTTAQRRTPRMSVCISEGRGFAFCFVRYHNGRNCCMPLHSNFS